LGKEEDLKMENAEQKSILGSSEEIIRSLIEYKARFQYLPSETKELEHILPFKDIIYS
jgi:hypothetical protein